MITPEFPKSIDSTMISTYTECPQRFFVAYGLKLAPSVTSPDLHAGGCLASGMETVRKAVYRDNKPLGIALGMGFEAMVKEWGDYEPPAKHPKTFLTTCYALTEYFVNFPPKHDKIQPYFYDNGEPAVEFTIAIPTRVRHPETGDFIIYSGRCDMLGKMDIGYGGPVNVIVDEKTTKGIGPKWHEQWSMRGQFYGYAYALNQGGIECEHAVVRAISLQTTQSKFATTVISIPHWRQERWWDHLNMKLRELVDRWKHMQEVIKNLQTEEEGILPYLQNETAHTLWPYAFGAACEAYGGCNFKDLCLRKNPTKWYNNYARVVWDPLEKNPTKGSENEFANLPSIDLPEEAKSMLGIG